MADNKAYQKKANISLVMQSIRSNKQISRIDISRELGLDRSTITNIVSRLLAGELLIELAEGSSDHKGGRKPVFIGINNSFGLILGLEIQVNIYRATLMGLDGNILWNKSGSNKKGLPLSKIVKNIYNELKPDIELNQIPLLGIGIGLPGHIDPVENKILSSSPFYTEDGFREDFTNDFDIPVLLDNDANCCAWGVLEDNKGDSIKNFLYSILEFSDNEINNNEIGFGIVVNGEVYYGSNFAAGELWNHLIEKNCTDEDLESYFTDIIQKLELFIAFLNPSHLFLGGEFIKHQKLILNLIKKSPILKRCEVEFSLRKQFDISFGAASMFIERLFKVPGLDNYNVPSISWEEILELRRIKKEQL